MAKNLKMGERVRIYCVDAQILDGTVCQTFGGSSVHVALDRGYKTATHPKQCRRLKPKVKKVPREVWLKEYSKWEEVNERTVGAVLFREVL